MIITPFGRPVVPEVYMRRCRSSPSTGVRGGAVRVGEVGEAVPAGDRVVTDADAGKSRSSPPVASFARSSSSSSHTSARAPECSRMKRSSGAASRQLTGIAIAPR